MQKLGILVGRPSEFKSKFGGRFHEYTLADKIRIEEREEMINTGEHKTPKAKLYYDVYRSRNMFDRIFKKNK
ncbi:MAG: hypothetical protein DRP02_02290 [Candidatus Gerdarchaeota archaeon]|nr:MAG: hypothetical protein DRP02_02290 [Candidatus Gerdarchaeota archaeon]